MTRPSLLREAIETLATEIETLRAERAAFEAFADRVEQFEVAPMDRSTAAGVRSPTRAVGGPTAGTTTGDILDAYRETVASTAAFEDYGEGPSEHFVSEFGEGIAGGLVANDALTPVTKANLQEASVRAAGTRAVTIDVVRRERAAVETAADRLVPVDDALADFQDISAWSIDRQYEAHARLDDLEDTCRNVAADRQEWLRTDAPAALSIDGTTGVSVPYLYRDLPVSHPVLAVVTDLQDRIDRQRRRIGAAIAGA